MKTVLTPEESQRLIDLGVDPKLASNEQYVESDKVLNGIELPPELKPCFTLTNLLSILPKEIDERNLSMEYDSEFKQWYIGYNLWHLKSAPELIDALYSLLIWCLENKIIKLKED